MPVAVLYSDAADYPKVFKGLLDAITMWQEKVHIHIKIHTVLTIEEWRAFDGLRIDIETIPDFSSMVGYYAPNQNLVVLDADLEMTEPIDYDIAMDSVPKLVALHELGHVLGLPHITYVDNQDHLPTYEHSSPGDIVFQTEEEAQTYIMFPVLQHSRATGISDMEAEIVIMSMKLPR